MKIRFILMLLIILPFIAHSQMSPQNQKWVNDIYRNDSKWVMSTLERQAMNKNIAADRKITKEEYNKKKLEEKTEKLNSDLKKYQDQLKNLESSNDNTNEDFQKKIEKAKEQIKKTEEKLAEVKGELETSTKIINDLKKEKEISLTRKQETEKKETEEKERKQKQDEINKALLKSVKSN